MLRKPRILFIGHDSTLTGAPILLLHLIELLKDEGYDVSIYLMRGGKLEGRYKQLGNCFILKPANYQKNTGLLGKVLQYLKFRIQRRRLVNLAAKNSDLVFNNTITNGSFISFLSKTELPIISYIHELQSVILQNDQSAKLTIRQSKLLITPSMAVKQNLVKNFQIAPSKCEMLPYYFPPVNSHDLTEKYFNFPGRLLVMAMGTATKRKGFDLFLRIAYETEKVCPHFHFVWIGGFGEIAMKEFFDDFMSEKNVSNVTITGELAYDPGVLKSGDLFLLTSREDPYPLVVIEAAQCGKPTIYFRETGGIEEFLGNDAGWGISPFDIELVVRLLVYLNMNLDEIKQKGENARRKVRKHEDRKLTLDSISQIFNKILNE